MLGATLGESPGESLRYRELYVVDDGAQLDARYAELRPTPFRIAEGHSAGGCDEALIIFPGFGVSVSQIAVDNLLYQHSRRYAFFVTHDAVNYRTSHDFLLAQYVELLKKIPARSINMLGLSLGGTTAVQLLFKLRRERELASYARVRKLVTLVAAIRDSDFTPRWQNILRRIRELSGQGRAQGEIERMLRRTVLRVVARAISRNVRRSCLEADSCDEIVASFTHFAEAYAETVRALPTLGLPDVEIVSMGLSTDGMVEDSRAHRYATSGRHVTLSGEHTPSFYSRSKDEYDRLLLQELG